ncbi:discoidin, CUB and LCCL domain-containing protein 1-like isoform X2 [Myxocyprinus asiaticus]|uniref:discoidin, CUB and LCCL domain-containing protein 1-like isoform X2 n=1 Tax=Myxocyprinus asiaticus TaxID=70543 RepID=UPI002222C134|nr:discoidin, CUB and LCCL domain-containing protein 1-like isoform X2 [Myxocyprinus asiaticus]
MHARPGGIWDTIEFPRIWLLLSIETMVLVCGQKGDGCGHTILSSTSGTLASCNFPGTYPNHTQCEWSLRVPKAQTLLLTFGDFDLEWSQDCIAGSLTITDSNGDTRVGPLCGQLEAKNKNVSVSTNEVTVRFISGTHRSGRGFVMSYSTSQHSELISCLHRGTHFSSQQISAFCPAGCKGVAGDIWGWHGQGYRDTSVLCKAAIHAGVISDSLGGMINVSLQRGITLYESNFANGILSKTGSLSDKRLVFHREYDSELTVVAYNTSSVWEEVNRFGQRVSWSPGHGNSQWAASSEDQQPWLALELWNRSSVTGIITKGTPNYYIESYTLMLSKDGKNWKAYKAPSSKERKVFEAYADGHLTVLNSLIPPVVARYLLLKPQQWHSRASVQVQVLGCPSAPLRPRFHGDGVSSGKAAVAETVPLDTLPTEGPVITRSSGPSQAVILVAGMVLGATLCVGCLLAGLIWWRRKRSAQIKKCCVDQGCQGFHGKKLPCTNPELISYPLVRNIHDALPNPPHNDYAEPDVVAGGQMMGLTFRPLMEEGYTVPFALNQYDTPGQQLPEYTDPLPPEPEYATPFGEINSLISQSQDSQKNTNQPVCQSTQGTRAVLGQQYDCPAHRVISNGYCTPVSHGTSHKASVICVEPQTVEPLIHTYHEPL